MPGYTNVVKILLYREAIVKFRKHLATALTIAGMLIASGSAHAQTVFDFEDEPFTFNPPEDRPGALSSLVMTKGGITITITRQSGVAFDLVQNIPPQAKPASWGNISLDPFFNIANGNIFRATFSVPVSFVSIDAGDYGADTDNFLLEAFSGPNSTGTLLDSDTFVLEPDGTNFTFDTGSVSAEGIRSIQFVGGSTDAPHSMFYDNITVLTGPLSAPEPGTLALLSVGVGMSGFLLRRKS